MGKIQKNQQGFGAVEAVLVLVIVILIGVVGWMVYKNHNKTTNNKTTASNSSANTSPQTKTTQAPDPYAGWQSYSDSSVSFKYPTGWQAGRGADKYATVDVAATSPGFTTSSMTTAQNPGAPVTLSLQLTSSSPPDYCNGYTCQIAAITPLANAQFPNAALAIVNQTSGNGTQFSEYVVVSNSTQVGDKSVTPSKSTNNFYIYGQPYYTPSDGGLTIAARITDTTALQADSHFKDLVSLVNSVKFN